MFLAVRLQPHTETGAEKYQMLADVSTILTNAVAAGWHVPEPPAMGVVWPDVITPFTLLVPRFVQSVPPVRIFREWLCHSIELELKKGEPRNTRNARKRRGNGVWMIRFVAKTSPWPKQAHFSCFRAPSCFSWLILLHSEYRMH